VLGHLVHRQLAHAARRIVDHRLAVAHVGQHDEVVEVPVQHTRQLQLRQVLHLGAQRPRVELHLARDAGQIDHRGTLQRQLEALTQRGQVGVQAVMGRHHRQAGKPALGRLGLQQQRDAAPAEAQPQRREEAADHPVTPGR
jgi:hypothetical protein